MVPFGEDRGPEAIRAPGGRVREQASAGVWGELTFREGPSKASRASQSAKHSGKASLLLEPCPSGV